MSIQSLIQNLPKAELHLHIEGTLEPELMFKLAKRNSILLPYASPEEIRKAYHFSDLQTFLDIYYEGASVLKTTEDFDDLCWEYLRRAHADRIVHTEIFFDPQTHTERGIEFGVVIEGLTQALKRAEKEWGLTSHLFMCFLRHLSQEEAFKTLQSAIPYLHLIRGVGLDSSELGHPPSKFKDVFEEAKKRGLELVAHAGEEGPPDYIWQALDLLQVRRIDHGVRSLEDPKLIERLKKERIPLTVCPLSNIKLRVFQKMQDHNLKTLLENGLCVTINSDDPAYFGGYLNQNFLETAQALDLSEDDLKQLAKNSFEASLIPNEKRESLFQEIDQL